AHQAAAAPPRARMPARDCLTTPRPAANSAAFDTGSTGRGRPRRRAGVLDLAARMTLLDALDDPALFAPCFPRPAWNAWRGFAAALHGLGMSGAERAVYAAATGRQTPPTARAREAWVICGRRSGKSRIASAIAAYTAALADTSMLAPGETGVVLVCAASK